MGINNFCSVKCVESMAIRSRRKNPLSSAEKTQALERVSSFRPKNPFFKLPMQPSYIFRDFLVCFLSEKCKALNLAIIY